MDRSISCSLLWSGCPTCRYKISTQVSQRSCSCSWGKKDASFSLCLSERRSYRHVTMVVLLHAICKKKPCTYTWYINYAVIIIRARRPADLEPPLPRVFIRILWFFLSIEGKKGKRNPPMFVRAAGCSVPAKLARAVLRRQDMGSVCLPLNPIWSAYFFIKSSIFLS